MITLMLSLSFYQLTLLVSTTTLHQSVRVQGKLVCNGTGYSDAKVILFQGLLVPLKLAEAKPTKTGDFTVVWSGAKLGKISPTVNIYHKCLYHQPLKFCSRMLSIQVPSDYVITDSDRINATFNIGITNLNIKYSFEIIDCIFGSFS
ncbi:hypothetical protein RB195_016877 [Necator americanus]|uniref:Transthyretin-like family protein n=1 Tax=Necator americanus TaxID=51031 RepID=A0ABR1C539_NECAM